MVAISPISDRSDVATPHGANRDYLSYLIVDLTLFGAGVVRPLCLHLRSVQPARGDAVVQMTHP